MEEPEDFSEMLFEEVRALQGQTCRSVGVAKAPALPRQAVNTASHAHRQLSGTSTRQRATNRAS